ncbi:MAG: B12-binding domain-containing radical SAM protein [Thermoguttaceae bacterium]
MILLINTNRMMPPIAPVGLDYLTGALRSAGREVELLDLCLTDSPQAAIRACLARRQPELVGITFRNVDDCFWPGHSWFVPELIETVACVRAGCDAPIVLGGVGFSVFAERLVQQTGADFGIRGDGEQALIALAEQLQGPGRFERVPGLIWRQDGAYRANPPAWPEVLSIPPGREAVDNATYFRRGGQIGVESRRGCNRACIYCADPLAKGTSVRLRSPSEVAEEIQSLLAQGVDVLHLCDSEFNIPPDHARAVCEELIRRRLGQRVRWYAYLAVVPFDAELAGWMRQAGCVGINFTGDSASAAMLATYYQPHRQEDLAKAVRDCRAEGIAVMIDLLFGGPGETPQTVAETIQFIRRIDPDCAGAALGIRLYPGTRLAAMLAAKGPLDQEPGIHRAYEGPIDLLRPNFYVSPALGQEPARLVRDLIAGDQRFFEPADPSPIPADGRSPYADYNYNQNQALVEAIAAGARGAYWHILQQIRAAARP